MTTEPCTTCGQTTHGEIHGGTMQDHEYEPLERCACEESEALRAELDDALARVDMLERPDRHYGAGRVHEYMIDASDNRHYPLLVHDENGDIVALVKDTPTATAIAEALSA